MKKLITAAIISGLAFASPAQAGLFNSGNSGLLGVANNLLGVQTGHVSVLNGGILNGGILNGSNVLSGNGHGNRANPGDRSTNVHGRGNTVTRGNGNVVTRGYGNTVVPGDGNVIGNGNWVGNQWGSTYSWGRR